VPRILADQALQNLGRRLAARQQLQTAVGEAQVGRMALGGDGATPKRQCGTWAPTAMLPVAVAMPSAPLSASRARMVKVMAAKASRIRQRGVCLLVGNLS